MKKLIIAITVLILAALPGIPFVNGILMERTLRAAVDNMNQLYAVTGLKPFEIKAYDRGVFDSRVEWRVDVRSLTGGYGIDDVVLLETARHGFTGIHSETSLEKNSWYADWVKTRLKGKDPFKIRTKYTPTGPIVSTITMTPIVVDTREPLNVGALELTATVNQAFTTIALDGRWDGMSENHTNKVGPVTLEGAHKRISDLIWEGTGAIAVESFSATENGSAVTIAALTLDYDLDAGADQKKMNMTMGAKTGDIIFNGRPLSEWAVKFSISNVDIPAYEAFAKLYYEIVASHMAQTAGAGMSPDAAGEAMQTLMVRNAPRLVVGLEKLMRKDLVFKISSLDLALPQGEISGTLSLGLKQDVTMAQCMMLAAQPALALDFISLDSEVFLPVALAGSRQQDLTEPAFAGMKTGLFIREGGTLRHRAETRGNKLFLNGQEVMLQF